MLLPFNILAFLPLGLGHLSDYDYASYQSTLLPVTSFSFGETCASAHWNNLSVISLR